jgi:hypothetical protein
MALIDIPNVIDVVVDQGFEDGTMTMIIEIETDLELCDSHPAYDEAKLAALWQALHQYMRDHQFHSDIRLKIRH